MAGCIRQLEAWGVQRHEAGGELPVPGVYGVPDQWSHASARYEQSGFAHTGIPAEDLHLCRGPDRSGVSAPDCRVSGTRLSAMPGDTIGYIEVEIFDAGERPSRSGGWAGVGNLLVSELCRRRGIGTWLLSQAADWLRAAGLDRLLDYSGRIPGTHQDQARMDADPVPVLTPSTTTAPVRTDRKEQRCTSQSSPCPAARM